MESKGTSEESIENIAKSNNTFAPTLVNSNRLSHAKFARNSLINNNVSVFRKIINLYISYTLDPWSRDLDTDFTWCNCLFGAVKLTKNADPNKYEYSG